MCLYGQGVVRGLFEELDSPDLKGFAVWLPMMPDDSQEFGRGAAEDFGDLRVAHSWDPDRQLGNLYARTLKLSSTAWDVYLLYAPGVRWENDGPPQPSFWMHQLCTAAGADQRFVLNAATIFRELLKLLGAEPVSSRPDIGLEIHCKGLTMLAREKGQHTLEHIRKPVEDSNSGDPKSYGQR